MENKPSDSIQQAPSIKGIHISRMNIVIILVSCILSILLTATASNVYHTLHDTYRYMDDFVTCSEIEKTFIEDCDYLTEQVRLYTVTADQTYMENYITEVFEIRSRQAVMNTLMEYELGADVHNRLQSVLEQSNSLVERELYAIRLTAASQGIAAPALPAQVQDIPLAEEDRQLSPAEMEEKAQSIVFSKTHQEQRDNIIIDIVFALNRLHTETQENMADSYGHFHSSMVIHRILIGIQFAATLTGFLFTILLVVLPMMNFVKCIRERKPLRIIGAYECRCLAQTCNAMFALNNAHADRLRYQAEHDALTGLLNRGAYDALQQELSGEGNQLGLLIVDVDKFKQVNDSCGHIMGDRVLKRVADLLTENFSAYGHPARIGGDEFAVILTAVFPDLEREILSRITAINETLTHPADGLPSVSLSVGGAFSPDGFSEGLYHCADLALYEVKEHGRCGCRFYSEEMAGATA